MSATAQPDSLTLDALRAMIGHRPDLIAALNNEAVKDKSYQEFPMGQEVRAYLASKRKRLTDSSQVRYETVLDKFARHFPYLELKDFEPPVGATRIEEFLDDQWGQGQAPGTYNVAHAIVTDFFRWQVRRGRMAATPMTAVDRAKKRQSHRTVFTSDNYRAILASAPSLRDRIALRLLLDFAVRKGALQHIQFKHFDHQRRCITIFTKGQKVQRVPIPEPAFWMDLERHMLEVEATPTGFLMCVVKPVPFGKPDREGHRQTRDHRFPDRMMSNTAMHRWWYRQLERAGIVAVGETSGEKMHKARHTAGQRILDTTGDLKLVQKLLGHASIQTTGDVYVDYDLDQMAERLAEALRRLGDRDE